MFINKPVTKKTYYTLYGIVILFGCIIFLAGCSSIKNTSYNPAAKLPPEKLKEDFTILKKVLEANHPSLYWYTPKDSIDAYFSETMGMINDSLTELQFKNKVAWFITKIRCGHTSVRPSKAFTAYASAHRAKQFPLYLKVWGDTLVLLASANKSDSLLKRGTVITSINGMSNRTLLDSMFQFISTDGYGDNFKNQVISFNFPLYYSFAFPLKDSFAINYIDTSGITQSAFVQLYKPPADTGKHKPSVAKQQERPSRKQLKEFELLRKRNLTYDTAANLAIMRVTSFTGGRLRSFFKESFEELINKNIPNLVIDLRENSGGSIGVSTYFARYIKNEPFKIADTVAAVNRSFTYGKYIHPQLPYQLLMRFTTRKKTDAKFHFTALENHYYKPLDRLHFNGSVYVLQGGYTFSAASMFILHVKGQKNVTVIGEETGGGNYGTSAVHIPTITLPNSNIQIGLPLYRVVANSKQVKNGKGIQPDIAVQPSTEFIRKNRDHKMEVVKELIQQKELHK